MTDTYAAIEYSSVSDLISVLEATNDGGTFMVLSYQFGCRPHFIMIEPDPRIGSGA